MDIMWVRQCPRLRVTFNISSSVAVKQLSQSACTTFKLSLLDIHKTKTEIFGHATKFLVAYMTGKGVSLVYKLNYLFLQARTKCTGEPGCLRRYNYLVNTLRTGDADLRFLHYNCARRMRQICFFNTRSFSLHNTLNYAIHRACLRMVLLTDVYRNLTSL